MRNHTPEPWGFTDHGQNIDGDDWYSINRGSIDIAYERWSQNDEPTRRANALRIVACVNACEGINPEAVPELLKACKIGLGYIEATENSLHGTQPNIVTKDADVLRAVIDKAEE